MSRVVFPKRESVKHAIYPCCRVKCRECIWSRLPLVFDSDEVEFEAYSLGLLCQVEMKKEEDLSRNPVTKLSVAEQEITKGGREIERGKED